MAKPNLVFTRKNTEVIHIKACDFEFLTGDTVYFTVKPAPDNDDTDAEAVIQKNWVVGTSADFDDKGYLLLKLDPSDTDVDFGDYYYDIKLVRTGDDAISQTLVYGSLTIKPAITLEH